MADFGIKVSAEGVDALHAGAKDLLLNTQYPLHKLDVTKTASFQNISIFFANEPPDISGTVRTLVYTSLPHGYTYIPATWFLFQNTNGANSSASYTYGREGAVIRSINASVFARLEVDVTDSVLKIYVSKTWDGISAHPDIAGYTIKLRCYVFAEDVGV